MAKKTNRKNNTSQHLHSESQQVINDLRMGRAVGLNFFRQNAWLIVIFVVVILALMGLRFKTMSKMSEIKKLTTELEESKSNKLQYKARYMSLIRETEMQRLVKEQGLNLEFQEQPPYELALDSLPR